MALPAEPEGHLSEGGERFFPPELLQNQVASLQSTQQKD